MHNSDDSDDSSAPSAHQYTDDGGSPPDASSTWRSDLTSMIEAGDMLPDSLQTRLVEAPSEATEALLEVLTDEELAHGGAKGNGWAPAHAAHILAERRDTEAIEPLVELLETCEPSDMLQPELIEALQSFGSEAFEPVMASLTSNEDRDVRASMLEVATHLEIRDDSLYREVTDFFEEDRERGAEYLMRYGDDRALELLYEALDDADVETSGDMLANQDIIEMGKAIRELGGDPPDHLIEKMQLVKRRRQRKGGGLEHLIASFQDDDSPDPAENERDLGRNEPCWCGSGQKYKHCHWREDRRSGPRKKRKKGS